MTVFARRPDRFIPALEIATVIAALLLGAFFAARLVAERPDPGVAAVAHTVERWQA
ncbi:MAG: hypothetical protein HZB56_14840 [Deltaproteobacteria bacterium]|nr:hypothetical protein [Deltaproteobacteria bacterium]